MNKSTRRYSTPFRRKVVSELESGKFRTISQAVEHYGIGGISTVNYWVKRFGNKAKMNRVVRIETVDEKDRLAEMKRKIRQLEKALASAKLDQVIAESQFEILCEEFGVTDIEALKKKLESKLFEDQ